MSRIHTYTHTPLLSAFILSNPPRPPSFSPRKQVFLARVTALRRPDCASSRRQACPATSVMRFVNPRFVSAIDLPLGREGSGNDDRFARESAAGTTRLNRPNSDHFRGVDYFRKPEQLQRFAGQRAWVGNTTAPSGCKPIRLKVCPSFA